MVDNLDYLPQTYLPKICQDRTTGLYHDSLTSCDPRNLERAVGFEPTNNSFAGCPLRPLGHARVFGGRGGIRTLVPISGRTS